MTYLRDGTARSLSPDTRTVTATAAVLLLSEAAKRAPRRARGRFKAIYVATNKLGISICRRDRDGSETGIAVRKQSAHLISGSAANSQEMEGHPMSNPDRIIRLKTVLDQTGLTRSTLYRKIDEGSFPRQIPISARGTGWRESEVRRWISDPMGYDADELDDLA